MKNRADDFFYNLGNGKTENQLDLEDLELDDILNEDLKKKLDNNTKTKPIITRYIIEEKREVTKKK